MGEKIKILLIEDNPADARLIDIFLKVSYGISFDLIIGDSLSKGLEILTEKTFSIIIVDLTLPDSSGLDTFKEIHQKASHTPVIVLTGHEDESVGLNAMKLGAQDFLIKGKLQGIELKRSINYSIERFKLSKSLSEKTNMLEEKTSDLLREKHNLSEAQKLAHVGSWEWDIKERTLIWSDELYNILGLTPEEFTVTYDGFIKSIHPEDVEIVSHILEESFNKLQPFDFHHRIVRPDNSVRLLHAKGEVLTDKQGNPLRLVGTEQDITERKREEELEKLALVASKSFNAVIIADKEGKIEWVNDGFTRLFGYKLEDVKGTYGEVLNHGMKTGLFPETDYFKTILKERKPITYENKNYSKDGTEYWILSSLTPVLNEKGEVEKIISIDSDISKQKKAEHDLILANEIAEHSLYEGAKALEELHKAKKELEKLLKVKEQFLANMSHEIRTPMNAIIGFTNLVLKSKLSDENKQFVGAIKTSGENLLVIINDILDFSKLESGKIIFENISFKLSQLINMLVELMRPKAAEKNINLFTAIDENIPDNLIGDPTRLNQILINLVGNAIKFTAKGEVSIKVSLVKEERGNVEIEFFVIDTGIGIPVENLSKIFESFTQGANDTSRKYGGTGLGLSISKQLVESQGGIISVRSKVNEGSCFSFKLNFKKSESQFKNDDSFSNKENIDSISLKGIKILLVEDNFLNQILAKKILSNWECSVEVADNGLIALEKIEKGDFDIVLMDIQMPEMDGYEATIQIRKRLPLAKRDIPIIAMTAHAFAGETEKCLVLGMDDYISKPFEENKLRDKIIKVLSSIKYKKNHDVK